MTSSASRVQALVTFTAFVTAGFVAAVVWWAVVDLPSYTRTAEFEMPPGVVIFEDPPTHGMHRSLLSRVFTPKKVAALEPKIREALR